MIQAIVIAYFITITAGVSDSNQSNATYLSTNQPNVTTILNSISDNTIQPDPCAQATSLRYIFFALFSIIVIVVGIAGNTLSIVVILTSRHLRSQVSNHFIVSLAIADLGVSFFITSTKTEEYVNNTSFCHGLAHCYYFIFSDHFFAIASITHLLVIAIDRCVAISRPFFYAAHFTKTVTKVIILSIWLYALLWTSFAVVPWYGLSSVLIGLSGTLRLCYAMFSNYYPSILVCVVYLIPMAITTCLYLIVLRIATKQAAAIAKLNPNARHKIGRKLKKDMRAYRTVAFVFTAYIICWLPHFIYLMVLLWSTENIIKFSTCCPTAYDAMSTTVNTVLPVLNSCMNPFIYFLSSGHFRVAFKDLLYKALGKPREGIYYADESSRAPSCVSYRGNIDNTVEETTIPRGKSFNFSSVNNISIESVNNPENDSKL